MEEASSLGLTLSGKELEMLAAVVLSLGDYPKVNFQKVGDLVGIKHGKNARTKFNTIWDKLKQACPAAASATQGAVQGDENDGNDADMEDVKFKTPKAIVTKKGTARAIPRTRKAAAGVMKAPRKRGKAVKSEVKVEVAFDEEDAGEMEEVIDEAEAERREAARRNMSVEYYRNHMALEAYYDPNRSTTPAPYLSHDEE